MITFIFTVIGFVFLIAKIIGVFVFYIPVIFIKTIIEIFRDIYKDISKGEYVSSGLPDVIEDAFR